MRILIVDDNAVDLKLFDVVLHSCGHETRLVDSVEDAFRVAVEYLPDVIVTDLHFKGLGGLALMRWIRADARTQAVAMVAVTAYPGRFPTSDLEALGCLELMVKPVDTRALPHALARIVKNRCA